MQTTADRQHSRRRGERPLDWAVADDAHATAEATAIVEGHTAEEAIAAVNERFGPQARIVEARRVLRGGIGGFFAKQRVELRVETSHEHDMPPTSGDTGRPETHGLEDSCDTGTPGVTQLVDDRQQPSPLPFERVLSGEIDSIGAESRSDVPPVAPVQGEEQRAEPTFLDVQRDVERALIEQGIDVATHERIILSALARSYLYTDDFDQLVGAAFDALASHGALQVAGVRELEHADKPQPDELVSGTEQLDAADSVPSPDVLRNNVRADSHTASTEMAQHLATAAPGLSWSESTLFRLGFPADLVRSLRVEDSADELAWLTALTEQLRLLCRPLPDGPQVLVGPDAPTFAGTVDAPVARGTLWLDAIGRDRWQHLVISGTTGWREGLTEQTRAVSWVRNADLPDALRCAVELGLVLGYGPRNGHLCRAEPLDVALAVRDLVLCR